MLAEFWTTVAWNRQSPWKRILPSRLTAHLERRSFVNVPAQKIQSRPWRELVRLVAKPAGLSQLLCSGERPFSVIGVYRAFDAAVARRLSKLKVDAVYAYEGGALETFRAAKKLGIRTIYELPSSYWYWNLKLLNEEAKRSPDYANLLKTLRDSEGHLKWKDEELELADHVIVPSAHVKRTLTGVVSDERITVINYGAPPVHERTTGFSAPGQPLRVIFVGALHQRKGIGYLIDAIESLDFPVDVTLVGMRDAANVRVDEACKRWHWYESLPHAKVLELMANADVLVHPSLSEGCALVVLEALAAGLPVIVTPNSGSLEFVKDGQQGFVIPVCDAPALAERLRTLDRDRSQLASMSAEAQQTARGKSWEQYRTELAAAVRAITCR